VAGISFGLKSGEESAWFSSVGVDDRPQPRSRSIRVFSIPRRVKALPQPGISGFFTAMGGGSLRGGAQGRLQECRFPVTIHRFSLNPERREVIEFHVLPDEYQRGFFAVIQSGKLISRTCQVRRWCRVAGADLKRKFSFPPTQKASSTSVTS